MSSLWEALGRPPRGNPLPPSRAGTWRLARGALRLALRRLGITTVPRSASTLWNVIHGGSPPAGATWDALCRDTLLNTLATKLSSPNLGGAGNFANWNVRWIRDHHTEAAEAKRAIVFRLLRMGRIVLLQETHWSRAHAATWASSFPTSKVCAAPCIEGPQGGDCGGVAVIVPAGYQVTRETILLDGCCLEVVVRRLAAPHDEQTFRCIYLPPPLRSQLVRRLAELPRPERAPHIGADLNMDMAQPRDPREEADAVIFRECLESWGTTPIEWNGPTCRNHGRESRIDIAAVPTQELWKWRVHGKWHEGLSDHICLSATTSDTPASMGRHCTPAALAQLPAAAFDDLRRRFRLLERVFNIPHHTPGPISEPLPGNPRGCDLAMDDPAIEVLCEDGDLRGDTDSGEDRQEFHGTLHHDGVDEEAPTGRAPEDRGDMSQLDDTEPRPRATGQADGGAPANHHPRVQSDASGAAVDIPWMPILAALGRSFQGAAVRSWWTRWKRHRPHPTGIPLDLERISNSNQRTQPAALTAAWLASLGHQGDLSPAEAIAWLQTWRSTYCRPPGRPRPRTRPHKGRHTEAMHVGRRLARQRHTIRGIRNPGGELITEPGAVDQILWESRAGIWGAAPPLPREGQALLRNYFQHRRTTFPPRMPARRPVLMGRILAAMGSAPGADDEPYEIYHYGTNFMSYLLGQACHATSLGDSHLETVLGPSVDLLIWIPKTATAETTDEMRGLQLPSCFRRHFGALIAEQIGRQVEPHLSPHQRGVRGGHCTTNVRAVYLHLEQDHAAVPPPRSTLWEEVLGASATGCRAAAERAHRPELTHVPAALLGDQSKAFERVSHAWIQQVMCGWRFPDWLVRSVLAVTVNRTIRSCTPQGLGPPRRLMCGIGQGGTASPGIWTMAYDPIPTGTSEAVGATLETFVDDTAALTVGPQQTVEAQIFLMVASRCAGLRLETHCCAWVEALELTDEAITVLSCLPVTTESIPDGWTRILGLPPQLLEMICHTGCIRAWCNRSRIIRLQCRCKIKTAVVPATNLELWAGALSGSAFGAASVVATYPYLGVAVTSRSADRFGYGRTWDAGALQLVQMGTWKKAGGTFQYRIETFFRNSTSPRIRAYLWNTYLVSLAPYPAQVCQPPPTVLRQMQTGIRKAFHTKGWAPWWIIGSAPATTSIAGAPRCLSATAAAAGAIGWLRDGGCGPPEHRRVQGRLWLRCVAWAQGEHWDPRCRKDAETITQLEAQRNANEAALGLRGKGATIYRAAWRALWLRRWERWMETRSASRRWLPTHGTEWLVLGATRSYSAYWHVLKLLAGGLASAWTGRPREQRTAHPRLCTRCGDPAVEWSWRTPTSTQTGVGWCRRCLTPAQRMAGGHMWAIPADGTAHALDPHAARELLREAEIGGSPPTGGGPTLGMYGDLPGSCLRACPLCGTGEMGAEHLVIWCPAVFHAWHLLFPGEAPLMAVLTQAPQAQSTLVQTARFLHQVSYLHSSLARSPGAMLEGTQASRWIVRAVRKAGSRTNPTTQEEALPAGSPDSDSDDRPSTTHGPLNRMWAIDRPCACEGCRASNANEGVIGGNRPLPHADPLMATNPALLASRPLFFGDTLCTLTAGAPHALWPVSGRIRWPPPRQAPTNAMANARWSVIRCDQCGWWRATLIVIVDILSGSEVLVTETGTVLGNGVSGLGTAISYDGSVRTAGDRRVGGAAAVLWGPITARGRQRLATRVAALPGVSNIAEAEAWGARLALGLLQEVNSGIRVAHILGDHPPTAQYGAGLARTQNTTIHDILDAPLAASTAAGWTLHWTVIPRDCNTEADESAKLAARRAAHLAAADDFGVEIRDNS